MQFYYDFEIQLCEYIYSRNTYEEFIKCIKKYAFLSGTADSIYYFYNMADIFRKQRNHKNIYPIFTTPIYHRAQAHKECPFKPNNYISAYFKIFKASLILSLIYFFIILLLKKIRVRIFLIILFNLTIFIIFQIVCGFRPLLIAPFSLFYNILFFLILYLTVFIYFEKKNSKKIVC